MPALVSSTMYRV